ncbi:MAG: alanine racemase [Candidatus Poribacteria bacterium]|nr:alanine racemase [Candidatus Poribacteria bacterium]
MHISELDTPALTVDLDVLERNINNMAALCREIGINLRVHTKTHKAPEIAKMQVAAGSQGITCQKLGEAEAMVDAGLEDILIPYNIVGKRKVRRLTQLVKRAKMTVALDSETTAEGISEQAQADGCSMRVLIEMDTGSRRCGVQSPQAVLELAQKVTNMPGLDFQGIMTYPSNVRAKPFIEEAVDLLSEAGMPINIISGGGTGSEQASKDIGCTETRSGSYVYEGMTRISGSATLNPERCALRMIVTVVSTPTDDRIIIDGGAKTFTSYPPTPYGHVVGHPDIKIHGMSVEHGHIDVSESQHKFRVGERLAVIPLHQGMTSNLHNELVAVRNEQVEAVWQIAGRGKVK